MPDNSARPDDGAVLEYARGPLVNGSDDLAPLTPMVQAIRWLLLVAAAFAVALLVALILAVTTWIPGR